MVTKYRPGEVRDAIFDILGTSLAPLPLNEIERSVAERLPYASSSSVRSYLRLNTPELFYRPKRAHYMLKEQASFYDAGGDAPASIETPTSVFGNSVLYQTDCFKWLRDREENSIHAVVTDPPYGLVEYSPLQQRKLRARRGGVWRIPPSFDGATRSPVPRFTVLKPDDLESLRIFFQSWAGLVLRVLVPGASVIVASNPLVSHVVSGALSKAGLERRGEIVRLIMTLRGGDRPKAAHEEFTDVSVMPRSMWEPWLVFRKPIEGRVQDNLRKWKTGGFRRPSASRPFGDVISSGPAPRSEKLIAPHPTLKPQAFLRQVVRGILPLGEGIVLDPFAGSGSTLAAAEALGYASVGLESDEEYFKMATLAVPRLAALRVPGKPNDRSSSHEV